MEDARREFQVFLSPTRTGMESASSSNVQRVIPVVNKFSSSSNMPFTLNQRRGSVYKAVSGISFQESDEKVRSSKKEKSNFNREKNERRSIVAGGAYGRSAKKISETRRSRSLTSIGAHIPAENIYNNNSVPEFVHPFSPTGIQNRLGRHDKTVRARKRASSQSRRVAELSIFDSNSSNKTATPPQPPRRARSASRPRKYDLPVSDEISLKQNRSSSLDQTSDIGVITQENLNRMQLNNNIDLTDHHGTLENDSLENFDVSDTDWKTYDKIVSEKLTTLLKAKEEPEGGYFSLERDECEETNGTLLTEDNSFQQDYYNESIYISQTLDQKRAMESFKSSSFATPIDSCNSRDCQDQDDEGLYEEIYVENSVSQTKPPIEKKHKISSGHKQDICHIRPPPRIERGPTSTVVYITSNSSPENTYRSNHSSSDSNQFAIMDDFLKSKRNIFIEQMNSDYFLSKDSARNAHNNKSKKNKSVSKRNDCFPQNSRANKFLPKVTLPVVNDPLYSANKANGETKLFNLSISEGGYARKVDTTTATNVPKKATTAEIDIKKSKSSGNFEKDYELSDLDFDMFAPKNLRKKRHTRAGDCTEYEKSLFKLHHLQFKSISPHDEEREIARPNPPNTFQSFLQNSIFNPPEGDFNPDYGDPLVITEDQVITCITDSSSDESQDDSEASNSSPWLEASKEFEYVTFHDKVPQRSARRRKKGIAHLTNMLNLTFSDHSSQKEEEGKRQSNVRHIPQRPSRSKHRNRSKKRSEGSNINSSRI